MVLIGFGAVRTLTGGSRDRGAKPRLVWGTRPIISLVNLSRAMRAAGYDSGPSRSTRLDSTHASCSTTPHQRDGNALTIFVGNHLRAYRFLMRALSRYDVFHYFFDGGVLT